MKNNAFIQGGLMILAFVFNIEALFAQSFSRNVQKSLDYPNTGKQISVRRIQHKQDVAILHGIQIVDRRGRRYFIREGYAERDAICQTFNFHGAFNSKDDFHINTPMTVPTPAYQMVRFRNNRLVPYRKTDTRSISMIEILPCKIS